MGHPMHTRSWRMDREGVHSACFEELGGEEQRQFYAVMLENAQCWLEDYLPYETCLAELLERKDEN